MFEYLRQSRPASESPTGKSLEELLRVLNQHKVTLSVATAVELVDRLCALLPGAKPLGGLLAEDIRFTSDARVLIAGELMNVGGRRRRRHRRDFLSPSLSYFSPEHVMGMKLDERSDVFNLAVLLHECLTGQRLFRSETQLELLEMVRYARVPPRDERIPVELDVVLRRALSEPREQRHPTVREFRQALFPFAGYSQLDEVLKHFAAMTPPPEPASAPPLPPGDERARLVYADWLEERGLKDEATWLRMESGLCKLKGEELEKTLGELRLLSEKVGTKFMASVARPAVEGCSIRFGFKCPLKWEAMQLTNREEVRFCRGCEQEVHFVRSLDDAYEISASGGCVALDPTLVRPEEDPDPQPGSVTGRLAI